MKQEKGTLPYVFRLTVVASLGGLLFGYDTAVVSGAVKAIHEYFVVPLTLGNRLSGEAITGFAVSSALIGCIIGGLSAGIISIRLGRKKGLMLAALLFIFSGFGTAFPEKMGIFGTGPLVTFILYRMIAGTGIGLASILSPMYIAEIAPARIRGRLVFWNQFAIVLGILIVYFVNWFISRQGDEQWNITSGWRWMFLSSVIPALVFVILLLFIPETPRYLILKNKQIKALDVLTEDIPKYGHKTGRFTFTDSSCGSCKHDFHGYCHFNSR